MWSCGSHVDTFQGYQRGHCKELALAATSPHCCPAVLLPSPTLPLALAQGSPSLFIANSKRHRNLQQVSITVFSSTCIQRKSATWASPFLTCQFLLLQRNTILILLRCSVPDENKFCLQEQIYPSCLIAQKIAVSTQDTHYILCALPMSTFKVLTERTEL